LVEAFGAVIDGNLHAQHLLATVLKGRQEPFQLLLAKLAEELFELLLGLVEFVDRFALVVAGVVLVALLDIVLRLFLVSLGILDLLAALGEIILRILVALILWAAFLSALVGLLAAFLRLTLAPLLIAAFGVALL